MKPSPILSRSLVYGGVLTLVIAVVGAVLGYLAAGIGGVFSALAGAALTAVVMGLNAASILLATRMSRNDRSSTVYFGIIVVAWPLKLALFLVAVLLLRGQPWLNAYVFVVVVIAAVIGSLITDIVAFTRARVPYVGDIELPGQSKPSEDRPEGGI